jgi:transketolase C-terminal domain/subunit
VDAGLVNLRQVKPLPEEDLVPLLRRSKRVVTVEEAVLDGGVGSAMASLVLDRNLGCAVLRVGLPCVFVEPGSNDELCRAFGLDADGILARIGARWPELDPQFARSA